MSAVVKLRRGSEAEHPDYQVELVSSPPIITEKVSEKKPRALLSGAELKSGYVPRNEFVDALFNRSIAAFFLALTLPIFAIVIVLQKTIVGGDIFYKGPRLGRDREIFNILKFRTLDEAKSVTSDRTLPRRNTVQTKIGPYLRACRLDELPQLINILRGDMVLFGPRPVRPEIEWLYASEARGYESRFAVRPGLVGLAQALTTHETPKAVRARINAMCCRAHIHYGWLLMFALKVGFCVLRNSVVMFAATVRDRRSPLAGNNWINSGFAKTPNCKAELIVDGKPIIGALCGMSDEVLQFVTTMPIPAGEHQLRLVRKRRDGRKTYANVTATVLDSGPVGLGYAGFAHHAAYEYNSLNTQYTLERYFLRSAIIPA